MENIPLNDEIAIAISQIVDDSSVFINSRKPSHGNIDTLIKRSNLEKGDPKYQGEAVGKAKRINAVLNWALEYDIEAGESFLPSFISMIKGFGGFRPESPNFVGVESIINLQYALKQVNIYLTDDGMVTPMVLENLSDKEMEEALDNYIKRAKRGASDAALLTGTSKDLLEAVAAYVITRIVGNYSQNNFPTLLGIAFLHLGLSTPKSKGENESLERFEKSLYELGCAINHLRNKQGTGHGRPFLPTVTDVEAKAAIESMGMISEYMLSRLNEKL